MAKHIGGSILAAALAVAACGKHEAPKNQNEARQQNVAAAPVPKVAPPAPAPASHPDTLTAKGIAPGLTFGMKQADALAVAQAAFGASTGKEHNDECGGGPLDLVSFHDLQLSFDGGRLAGWSLSGPVPALRAKSGLAIGAPRSVLGGAQVDEEGSLGPEFEVSGVGGILDEKGAKVEALWAGLVCQFR